MKPFLRSAIVFKLVLLGATAAWAQGTVGYQLQTSSGDYTNHAFSANLDKGSYWGSLRAASGYAGSTEVDQTWALGVGGAVGSRFDLDINLGQTQDTALRIVDYSLGVNWKTPWQWAADSPLQLGASWGYADYSLRNSALVNTDGLPDQYHWGLNASLPITDSASVSLESHWNWYTVDPVAIAAQLLQRRRPSVNAAMSLADFASVEHRAGVSWRTDNKWRWSLGASYGQTVLGKSQRSVDGGLEVPWGSATTVGLSVQHAQDDEVRRANGQVAIPYQTSNSLSFHWNWSWN